MAWGSWLRCDAWRARIEASLPRLASPGDDRGECVRAAALRGLSMAFRMPLNRFEAFWHSFVLWSIFCRSFFMALLLLSRNSVCRKNLASGCSWAWRLAASQSERSGAALSSRPAR
eukprot:scaffold323_cov232-Pinguiococcus_pyrenoidosus.AAC.8